jgi:mersacidin/lichenicidin family type 2 lantibiotic
MSHVNVVRAWKDEAYRNSLTDAERAALPENPAGLVELPPADLGQVAGGALAWSIACNVTPLCTFQWSICYICWQVGF